MTEQRFKIFYSCSASGDQVGSDNPYETDRDSAIGMALQLLRGEGDFFGIIDGNDVVLQFIVEADARIRVDLPVPTERGSYCREVLEGELEPELLRVSLPHRVPPQGDFRFESW